ncbi:MAG TPA: ABC transporter permease [Candidatus Limnocylindrales bacterium]|nr:ABC transporter permease [Candidatus Limnocylindrales bacterium]
MLTQDIRYGMRMLRKNPGFTAVAILTLALGIGANAAVFSVANAFLRKPIWFPAIDSLVVLTNVAPGGDDDRNSVTPADYLDWKAQSNSFEKIGAFEWRDVNLTGNGDPLKLSAAGVSTNFFDILQIQPELGRAFLPAEDQPGKDQAIILGHALWANRFGSDPNIVGKTVRIDGLSRTVVGVMADDFDFPVSARIWLPLALSDREKTIRNDHYIHPVARLRPGVTAEQAEADLRTIEGRLQKDFPLSEKGWNVRVLPMRIYAADYYSRQYSVLLLCAVSFVLLIACANVANVQLARTTARNREFAVREAMGASRWRIIRQLLTESALLSIAGGVLGLFLANWAIALILAHMPPDVARYIAAWKHIQLDTDVFAYTLAIALTAGIISGLAPALQGAKTDLMEQLKEGGRGTSAGRSRRFLRSAFVVGEIAASLILLLGAGLTIKGVHALLNAHRGLAPESLLTMGLQLPPSKYKDSQKQAAFYERLLQQLNAAPGVKTAAIATQLPFGESNIKHGFRVEGIPEQPGEIRMVNSESVNSDYFCALNIPLREGRYFSEQDGTNSPRVAIISQRLAQRFWPRSSAIGKRIQETGEGTSEDWATIVGIVGDIRYDWNEREDYPALYFPYKQVPRSFTYVALRAGRDPMALVPAARTAVEAVDPDQPVFEIKTFDRLISESVVGFSYVAAMMGVLGVIALVLGSVGVYGVMAYSVVERTHEIGMRLALGAQPKEILKLMLSRGVILTGLGLLIGLPISFMVVNLLASLFFGVSSTDLSIFTAVPVLLTAISILACYIPARRAMRVDPMVALRYE